MPFTQELHARGSVSHECLRTDPVRTVLLLGMQVHKHIASVQKVPLMLYLRKLLKEQGWACSFHTPSAIVKPLL